MPRPSPVDPNRITLRVCADLDWRLMIHCAGCRHATMLHLEKLTNGALAAEALPVLLEAGAFKCRTRCDGRPADGLTVSFMDVGVLRDIAGWDISTASGIRAARLRPAKLEPD